MATIKDLAMVVANRIYSGWDTERIRQLESAAAMAARQQDRIARREERERCIKAAQDAHCRCCKWYDVCTSNGFDIKKTCIRCDQREQIRKAIEEGGNQ